MKRRSFLACPPGTDGRVFDGKDKNFVDRRYRTRLRRGCFSVVLDLEDPPPSSASSAMAERTAVPGIVLLAPEIEDAGAASFAAVTS